MSTSPSTKRNIKPSPISASSATQVADAAEAPTGQQMGSTGEQFGAFQTPQTQTASPINPRKRRASGQQIAPSPILPAPPAMGAEQPTATEQPVGQPVAKKTRTNTPWTPTEEQRLKIMRDEGKSWSEIAKAFPLRTEGSVKKHWYKDMHYAEFAEDESAALLAAIKEYEANKWKVIGQKVGKPAKACEQYAKEHGFIGKV